MINEPIIVGAGPVGLRVAQNLINAGMEPLILEEHDEVGVPVQCAGLISTNILKIHEVPESCIINRVYGAKFVSDNDCELIMSKSLKALVVNRALFDKSFINERMNILRGHKVISHESTRKGVRVKTVKSAFSARMLIDCSGPKRDLKLITGIQARVRFRHDPRYVELHFNACNDFFGWVIPESDEISRIGVATAIKPRESFNQFLKKLGVSEVIELIGGVIPMSLASFCDDNFIRVGDSAGQVKATTGGGVITGLLSADLASKAVIKAYNKGDYSKDFFVSNYFNEFKKGVGSELKLHYRVRRALNNFNVGDYDNLIRFLRRNKGSLLKYGDMDFPKRFLYKLALNPLNYKFIINSLMK